MFGIPQLMLAAALGALIAPLSWLFGAIAWFVSALALAYDALDWPLARRGLGARARIAWMGEQIHGRWARARGVVDLDRSAVVAGALGGDRGRRRRAREPARRRRDRVSCAPLCARIPRKCADNWRALALRW